ncbi:conserved hypothetical protein [Beggiatoa sp. PS]|nr:conserved hypothetical protein [Beggiatoa sp. PS]
MILPFLLASCFTPAIVTEFNSGCQLATKKLELKVSGAGTGALLESLKGSLNSQQCSTPECLLVVPLGALAISVTSLVVSGSIVVVGNTIHWLEKEGKCEQGTMRSIVNQFVDSIKFIGGKTIQSTNDLMTWFKQHLGINY